MTRMKVQPGDAVRIEWLMDREHVGTPDEEIRRDILRRVRASKFGYPQGYDEACADYAIEVMNRNRGLFARVATGRL